MIPPRLCERSAILLSTGLNVNNPDVLTPWKRTSNLRSKKISTAVLRIFRNHSASSAAPLSLHDKDFFFYYYLITVEKFPHVMGMYVCSQKVVFITSYLNEGVPQVVNCALWRYLT